LVLTPGENGYQIAGAFGLHLTPGGEVGGLLVCDRSSSGGPQPDLSHTLWLPISLKPGQAALPP
jgi:hypothetical protein